MTITLTREEAQKLLDGFDRVGWARTEHSDILRARLSAPEPKPVAWMHSLTGGGWQVVPEKKYPTDQPLYPAPPKREFIGLTDKEREEATGWSVEHIESFLRGKNI
jgi:hypothetical protein